MISVLFDISGCSTDKVQTDLLLPVDFSNIPDNMVLTYFHTDKIEIRIQADPKLIERINLESTRYPVDLYTDLEFDPAGDSDSIEPGAYLIPVEKKRIPMNPAIKILAINPPYLSVQIEKKIKKTFAISVPYTGEPAKGYIALDAATEPASVELTGAASLILSIKELKTKPIDLNNAKEDFKKNIPLDLDNSSIISSSDPIIIVTIPIQQQLVSKSIENIPVQVWNCTSRVTIEPSFITIRVKGPFETLNNMEIMGQIHSFIDLKNLKPGVYARHAYINIPVGLVMTDAVPHVFTVKIE
ncbi:CdaR family protein [Desulfobacula toluolica]|uniref:CdaR family protein n=1 Tax=Desulfobacula toluolica TaxID=28223 RepID=UPI001E4EA627|nr:CdaR family protein [Desulfobacula toluolica]